MNGNALIRTFLSLLLTLSSLSSVNAKTAVRTPIQCNDSLLILKFGDEFNHIITTVDTIPLVQYEGSYHYATIKENGEMTHSPFTAHSPHLRTPFEKKYISSLPAKAIREGAGKRISSTRRTTSHRQGLMSTSFPSTGVQKGLVVLVQFRDLKYSIDNPAEYFRRQLNEPGFSDNGATGSARDWFIENSNGAFLPQFDVLGPVTLPQRMSYYGRNNRDGNDTNPTQIVTASCITLDAGVDFREYDRDNDGYVDNVYVIYAGYGEADSPNPDTIWPHSWSLKEAGVVIPVLDGVSLNHYACSSELNGTSGLPDGIGTFVHEFSHVLGLPDLYCTSNDLNSRYKPFTPGTYSTLDYGPYNNLGRTPPNYSAYERYALGWLQPEELSGESFYTLENIADCNKAYIVKTSSDDEYFLFENRQQTGNDAFIPGHGMAIWHIDFIQQIFDDNIVNNDPNHQYVDLIEADGSQFEMDRPNDLFPGASRNHRFTTTSRPKFVTWGKEYPSVALHDIEEADGIITFRTTSNPVQSVHTPSLHPETIIYYDLYGNIVDNPLKGIFIMKTSEGVKKIVL